MTITTIKLNTDLQVRVDVVRITVHHVEFSGHGCCFFECLSAHEIKRQLSCLDALPQNEITDHWSDLQSLKKPYCHCVSMEGAETILVPWEKWGGGWRSIIGCLLYSMCFKNVAVKGTG